MADALTLQTPDMQAYLRELFLFPDVMRKRLMVGTVATGAAVIKNEAIRLAPLWTGEVAKGHPKPGTLKKAIYQVKMVEFCNEMQEVWKVDVRRGATAKKASVKHSKRGLVKIDGVDAYYALWVEYGHYTRTPGMDGKQHRKARSGVDLYTGSKWVPGKSYMRESFRTQKQAALDAMQTYLDQNLPDAANAFKYLKARAA